MTVVSYPTPPYSNPPITPQYYLPKRFVISNVTLGVTTTVTSATAMDYVVGQLVRLLIPQEFGCFQLNEVQGYVISIPMTTQVVLDINSSQNVNAYIAATSTQEPQIIPVGDVNTGAINSQGRTITGTFVPGSFINISPL